MFFKLFHLTWQFLCCCRFSAFKALHSVHRGACFGSGSDGALHPFIRVIEMHTFTSDIFTSKKNIKFFSKMIEKNELYSIPTCTFGKDTLPWRCCTWGPLTALRDCHSPVCIEQAWTASVCTHRGQIQQFIQLNSNIFMEKIEITCLCALQKSPHPFGRASLASERHTGRHDKVCAWNVLRRLCCGVSLAMSIPESNRPPKNIILQLITIAYLTFPSLPCPGSWTHVGSYLLSWQEV